MSEMIERAARAAGDVYERYGQHGDLRAFRPKPELLEAMVRAAVSAMREPTEKMLAASAREWDGRMSYRSSGAWQAMIDEALKQ